MSNEDEIETTLVELAKDVASTARLAATGLPEKVEALKTLSAVYLALKKHKNGEKADDEDQGFNFQQGVTPPPEEPADEPTVTPIRSRRRPG
jgi:hypothetical protein